jgi:hypothetical protein
MIRKILTISATALLLTIGAQGASAATVSPEVHNKAPVVSTADGNVKVAWHKGKKHKLSTGAKVGIGIGAFALGAAAAAAAADDRRYRGREGSCNRVERRCARRHGWETRRFYWCVEDRGC